MRRPTLTAVQVPRLGARRPVWRFAAVAILALYLATFSGWTVGCDSEEGPPADGGTTSSTEKGEVESGDIDGVVGDKIKVGAAIVTVRALQATFQPAVPEQRLSEQTPPAPGSGESFYQAYVTVENTDVSPLRVNAKDFVCAVGDSVVAIEPTRSGPLPRSLLKNTSLDLLLTFKAETGYQPILIYRPAWYSGVITVSPAPLEPVEETSSTS